MKVHDAQSATASSDPATSDPAGRPEVVTDSVVTDTAADRPMAVAPATVRGRSTYRLIGELGRGGMGTVYLAERADGEYRQRVALKLLRGGSRGGEEQEQRFRIERQILASLDHPCIARLLDGGSLPDGSPFLVMELVEGRRIDRYCAEEKLPARSIVELVLQVCAAVSAAHQRLVVHRDLKPGNILVTAAGTPKLLDFGIAKLLDPAAADMTAAETRAGLSPLTARYASPEQVVGEPITTASDVYSLAVVLYELLTGVSPYGADVSLPALFNAVSAKEPVAPSAAVLAATKVDRPAAAEHKRLGAALAGDLDAILLKALRKRPAERYASVEAFAEDLRRHLDGRPVTARKGTWVYRGRKLVRRRRWPLTTAALILAMIAGAAWSERRQVRLLAAERDRANVERDRANVERDRAGRVADFLVDLFDLADPETSRGETVTARELLDRGSTRIDEELAGQPAVQVTLLRTVGRVYSSLGLFEPAETHLRRAVEIARGDRDDDPIAYAEALSELGRVVELRERLAEARPLAVESLDLLRVALPADDPRLLAALNRLANLDYAAERYDESEAALEEVLAISLRRLGISSLPWDPAGTALGEDHGELAKVFHNLGNLAYQRRDLALARQRNEQALAIKRHLLGDEHLSVAVTLMSLGNVADAGGDYETALEFQERALALRRKILGDDHPSTAYSWLNTGNELMNLGRLGEGRERYERALSAIAKSFGPDSFNASLPRLNLGMARVRGGETDAGLAEIRRALAGRLRHFGEASYNTAIARGYLAEGLLTAGQAADALAEGSRAAETLEAVAGADHPDTLGVRIGMGRALVALGREAEAAGELRGALAGLVRSDAGPLWIADARLALAEALAATPDGVAEARQLAAEALAAVRGLGPQAQVDPGRIEALLESTKGRFPPTKP